MRDDFAVFILTHGRPDRVLTYDHLRSFGYTGRICLIVDDEDKTQAEYINRDGDATPPPLEIKHHDSGEAWIANFKELDDIHIKGGGSQYTHAYRTVLLEKAHSLSREIAKDSPTARKVGSYVEAY